ncbi:MAG: hypothetical protein V4632_06200 [Pseudomonadota bacterium]
MPEEPEPPEEPGAPVEPELPLLSEEPAPVVPVLPDMPGELPVAGAELAPEPMSDDDPDVEPPPSVDVQAIRKTHAKDIIHLVIKKLREK